MNRHVIVMVALMIGACSLISRSSALFAGDQQKSGDQKSALDILRTLDGTWESDEPGQDGKPMTLVFHVTSAKSVIWETMFPGSNHEMVNAYHLNGDELMMTHYCAQGVQPRMKMVSNENGTMKFEFVDCTNLKPGQPCMGGFEMIVNGDKLTEKWYYRTDGKLGEATTFELHRKS